MNKQRRKQLLRLGLAFGVAGLTRQRGQGSSHELSRDETVICPRMGNSQ